MSETWERIWSIFEEAVGKSADDRREFIEAACGNDLELRRTVEEMLAADGTAESFLDRPLIERSGDNGAKRESPPKGTIVGSYRLERKVGEGGMSSVFLATRQDDSYQRRVVVKVVRPGMEREAVLRRLRTERQILASLEHPHIARLYDGGSTEDGLPYFVMELVDGLPVDLFTERNQLDVGERLVLFRKICSAVHYAHQNLVVHRDIKPSNIMVTAAGEPKLLDFGIAKLLNPELAAAELESTVTVTRMLTPSYASPEQIRGELITTASDVYSLGVLLYRLLSGCLPYDFSGRSPSEIERLVTDGEPPRPSQVATATTSGESQQGPDPSSDRLRRQLAGDLDAIVLKAMRSAPAQRYGSVEALAADVDRYLEGRPVSARRGSWRYRSGKFLRRHRTAVLVGALIAALVINFGVVLWRQAENVRFERDQARLERDRKQKVISLFEEIIAFAEPYVAPGEELSVRQAVERSAPVLGSRLESQPEVRSQLLHTAGSMLTRLGAFESAGEQIRNALETRRSLYGEGSPEVADSKRALASLLKLEGQYDDAERLAREAVETMRQVASSDDPDLVAALNELVSVLCFRERFEAADEFAAEALELARRLGDDERLHRLVALGWLATIRNKAGEYRQAADLMREGLALRRSLYGEDHPSQRPLLNNLALTLRWLGEFDAAERTYREFLDLTRLIYGDDHWEYAFALNNVGGLSYARGEYARAFEEYSRAAEIFRASVGADHWRNFFLSVRVEGSRVRAGDPRLAETNLRREIPFWQERLGEDHWLVVSADGVLGEALAAQGRTEEAAGLLTASFVRLVELAAKDRFQRQALDRLSRFLEENGRGSEVPRYAAMIAGTDS